MHPRTLLRARFWAIFGSGLTVLAFVVAAGWVVVHQQPGTSLASVQTENFPRVDVTPDSPTPQGTTSPGALGSSLSTTSPQPAPTGTSGVIDRPAPPAPIGSLPSPSTAAPGPPTVSNPPVPPIAPPPATDSQTVRNDGELRAALAGVRPGGTITLADGLYSGEYVLTRSGTVDQPIVISGSVRSVLRPPARAAAGLHLDGARHVRLEGFAILGGRVGILIERAVDVTVRKTGVRATRGEGIWVRAGSIGTVVEDNDIALTGLGDAREGAGVAIGSPADLADGSDRSVIHGNTFAATGAEAVRVYAGTSDGVISGNSFGNLAARGAPGADSWVEVGGNGYRIEDNRGKATNGLVHDGLTTLTADGWGRRNTFATNQLSMASDGYGIYVRDVALTENVVKCDNTVTGAGAGVTNASCG